MRIILIVGLPASGKSFLLKHFPSHFDIYDDLDKIEDLNFNSENIVICHPSFCRDSVLEDAMIKLNKMFNFDHVECYYFENNVCNKVILSTKSILVATQIINWYTRDYEKVGNNQWKMSSTECGRADIVLEYSQNYYK